MDDLISRLREIRMVVEKKPPLGSGERFQTLVKKIAARGDVEDPKAVAAAIGRKKYGAKKFQALARRGRARAGKREAVEVLQQILKAVR